MSLSLANYLGDSILSDAASSPQFERLGLGTTGLGRDCNKHLAKDADSSIKSYLAKKDKEMMSRQRDDTNRGGKVLKYSEQQALLRQIQEKIAAKREEDRQKRLAERQATEARLKAEREQAMAEARDAVERERVESRRRAEQQALARQEYEERRRQRLQDDIAQEREIMRQQEELTRQAFETKQLQQRKLREAQRQYADKEREQRHQQALDNIAKEKKKITKLREEAKQMHESILFSKKDEIKNGRSEREKKEQRLKELKEKEKEAIAEIKVQEKQLIATQKQARKEADLGEKRKVVEKVKREIEAARLTLLQQREEWVESKRNGADSPSKPPTSPMFPQVRSAMPSP